MKNRIKRVLAIICSLALVVSSVTIYSGKNVSADTDWSGYSGWTKLTYDNHDYYLTHDGSMINKIENLPGYMTAPSFRCNFVDVAYSKVVVNGKDYASGDYTDSSDTVRFLGAQVWIAINLCSQKKNIIEVYNGSTLKDTVYVYNENGTGEGVAILVDPVGTITESNGVLSWGASAQATSYVVTIDGTEYTTTTTSYDMTSLISAMYIGNHTISVVASDGTNKSAAKTYTYVREAIDGGELLRETSLPSGTKNWVIEGFSSYTLNGDGTVALSVPAKLATDTNYGTQFKQELINLEAGKWYVAKVTITSSVARKFQLLVQSDGGHGGNYDIVPLNKIIDVEAGVPYTIEEKFCPASVTNQYLFGIMMGAIDKNASSATSVTVSNLSLKYYNSEPTIGGDEPPVQDPAPTTPTGLAISADKVLTWSESQYATSYDVKIGDTVIAEDLTVLRADLSTAIDALAYGQYTIAVIAKNSRGTAHSTINYTKQNPLPQMNGNPLIAIRDFDNGNGDVLYVAGLDAITNAVTYKLYVDGEFNRDVTNGANLDLSQFPAGEHLFQVSGVNTHGESSLSEGYTITIPGSGPVKQAAPTGFTAQLVDNNTKVKISWQAPTTNCFLYIDGVRYDNSAHGVLVINSEVQITETLNTSTKLTAGSHSFAIATVTDDTFGESEKTEAIALTIPETQPIEVEAMTVTDGIGQITVMFQESSTAKDAGEQYDIYVDGTKVRNNVSQGEYVIEKEPGTYDVKVVAKILDNRAGHASEYLESTGTIKSVTSYEVGTPANVQAVGGTNTIDVTWEDTVTTNVYCIYLDDAVEAAVTTIAGARTATLTDVTAGTHTVTVKAHVLSAYSNAVTSGSVNVYDPPTKVDTITVTTDYNTFTVSWGKTNAASYVITVIDKDGQELNITPEDTSDETTITKTYKNVPAGTYTISVVAKNPVGATSDATTKQVVVVDNADAVLVSDDIAVKGFQIRINSDGSAENEDNSVAFRTVCKAPDNKVTVQGKEYTIASYGTIYTFDTNKTGDKANNVYNVAGTILSKDEVAGHAYKYIGKNVPDRTFGYIATQDAFVPSLNTANDGNKYYATTMQKMDNYTANGLHIRAFVIATDGTFIYSSKTAVTSVAQIASNMYEKSMAQNITGHEYLFNSILNSQVLSNASNKYYRTEEQKVEYGWNSNIYQPPTSIN